MKGCGYCADGITVLDSIVYPQRPTSAMAVHATHEGWEFFNVPTPRPMPKLGTTANVYINEVLLQNTTVLEMSLWCPLVEIFNPNDEQVNSDTS